jgi:hypothetical protein
VGERPYSKVKIFFAVLMGVIIAAVVLTLYLHSHGSTTTHTRRR